MSSNVDALLLAYQILTCGKFKLRKNVTQNNLEIPSFFNLTSDQLIRLGATRDIFPSFFDPYLLAEKEIARAKTHNISIIHQTDPRYPQFLRNIFDPPVYLYVLGKDTILNNPVLGIVGSREHSDYSVRILQNYLPIIASCGLTTISGMAYGVDALAHHLTVKHNGLTIGVNAGGLLHLYPQGNKPLFREILKAGAIVSEFPLDTSPRPFHFPVRNRIIAGICQKLWVVEAAERSGSLITARLANENGRDVFATPGPVDVKTSLGTNKLIRDGAKPVLEVNDILEDFGVEAKDSSQSPFIQDCDSEERALLDLLKVNEVKEVDFLVKTLQMPTARVLSNLNGLLLKGVVNVLPGGGWKKL